MAKEPQQEQAQPGDVGMELPDIKKLLKLSRRKPVNCALAQGDSPSGRPGLILLDKIKVPKVLVRSLKEKFPTLRTPVFGTASVDTEADAKLVTFTMNKRIPSLERCVRKSLKGSGFNKVAIQIASDAGGDEGDEANA